MRLQFLSSAAYGMMAGLPFFTAACGHEEVRQIETNYLDRAPEISEDAGIVGQFVGKNGIILEDLENIISDEEAWGRLESAAQFHKYGINETEANKILEKAKQENGMVYFVDYGDSQQVFSAKLITYGDVILAVFDKHNK